MDPTQQAPESTEQPQSQPTEPTPQAQPPAQPPAPTPAPQPAQQQPHVAPQAARPPQQALHPMQLANASLLQAQHNWQAMQRAAYLGSHQPARAMQMAQQTRQSPQQIPLSVQQNPQTAQQAQPTAQAVQPQGPAAPRVPMTRTMAIQLAIHREQQKLQLARAHIARLHMECRMAESNLTRLRYSLSRIARLPDELLRMVFCFALPPTDGLAQTFDREVETGARERNQARNAPVVLTRVCRTWRTLARDTSELWSFHACNFAISGAVSQAELAGLVQAIRIYPNGPLELFLWFNNVGYFIPDGLSMFLREQLVPRLSGIILNNVNVDIVDNAFRQRSAPLLRNLNITHFGSRSVGHPTHWQSFPWLNNSSNLSSFYLNWPTIDVEALVLPFAQLTTLDLRDGEEDGPNELTWQACYDILARCTQIVRFTMSSHGGPIDATENIVAPALAELILETVHDCSEFLDMLVLPALSTVRLGADVFDDRVLVWPGDALLALIKRSSCKVTSLALDHVAPADETAFGYLLRELRELVTLELVDQDTPNTLISDNLIAALAYIDPEHNEPALVPRLEELELVNYRTVAATPLAEIVEARREPDGGWSDARCLRRVTFECIVPRDVWNPEDPGKQRLKYSQDKGMDVRCDWLCRDAEGALASLDSI